MLLFLRMSVLVGPIALAACTSDANKPPQTSDRNAQDGSLDESSAVDTGPQAPLPTRGFVPCSGNACAIQSNVCCALASSDSDPSVCAPTCADSDAVAIGCDAPEDCVAPQVCCALQSNARGFDGTRCMNSTECTVKSQVVCHQASDCSDAQQCADMTAYSVPFKICE